MHIVSDEGKEAVGVTSLSVRQNRFLKAYADPMSPTFSNAYQSAKVSGYSEQTARNFTHLKPSWLSESIGNLQSIQPEEIMQSLTAIIHDAEEPTIIRLKAMELSMRAHNMLTQRKEPEAKTVYLAVDLTGTISS